MLIELLSVSNLFGQIDTINRLYTKIMFEDINVKDSLGNFIVKDDVFDLIYKVDSVANCYGEMKEEFIDNLYLANGIIIITSVNEIIENKNFNSKSEIEFIRILREETGEYLKNKKIFRLSSQVLDNLNNPINFNSSNNDERLITGDSSYWLISEIIREKKRIYIDDCHKMFKLQFKNKSQYSQDYNGNVKCLTKINRDEIIRKGYLKYWEEEIKHSINFIKGKWKTENNKLYLANFKENKIKIVPYQIEGNTLILKPTKNYKIVLKYSQ